MKVSPNGHGMVRQASVTREYLATVRNKMVIDSGGIQGHYLPVFSMVLGEGGRDDHGRTDSSSDGLFLLTYKSGFSIFVSTQNGSLLKEAFPFEWRRRGN